ncbi:MAG: TolC family protein [Armatimonadota bacterium]
MTIPVPIVLTSAQHAEVAMDFALSAALRSPQVIAAASNVKSAFTLARSGRSTASGQLTIAPWLGSPNGTTEEFLFTQSLEAGGRRTARVSSPDVLLLDAQSTFDETLVSVYSKILVRIAQLLSAERSYTHALHIENNLAETLRVIEIQVLAGTKPGSDLEVARAMWNAAQLDSQLALARTQAHRTNLEAYAVDTDTKNTIPPVFTLPDRSSLVSGNSIELRGAVSAARLSADRLAAVASGRPDISIVIRSQNFTRNFTPNDRGLAVQVSIPIDHGTNKANSAAILSQLSNIKMQVKDDQIKQTSLRIAIDANIAGLDIGIAKTQEAVIRPLSTYVSKMQRAYTAGTVTVLAFLDAQRSYHDAKHKLITLQDQRDMALLQLIEQGGMVPNQLVASTKQTDRKRNN